MVNLNDVPFKWNIIFYFTGKVWDLDDIYHVFIIFFSTNSIFCPESLCDYTVFFRKMLKIRTF